MRIFFKFFLRYEKEEKWLNEQSAKGLHMIFFGFPCLYMFQEGEPGKYIYWMELLEEMPNEEESKIYLMLRQASGAEVADSFLRWVYFRIKAVDGPLEVFPDWKSRYDHYKRIASRLGTIAFFFLLFSINQLLSPEGYPDFWIYFGALCLIPGTGIMVLSVSYLVKMYRVKPHDRV